jgi:hypothetical protein
MEILSGLQVLVSKLIAFLDEPFIDPCDFEFDESDDYDRVGLRNI